MVAVSTRGTIFRIGLNQKYFSGYLILGDADWASLEEGKKYKVVIQLDDLTPWDAEATGFRFKSVRPGDFVFLNINFKNPDFLEETMRRNLFKLKYKNPWVCRLKLKGSYTA